MAVEPVAIPSSAVLRLEPFRPECAPRVASWVRDEQEAYWIAPRTPPPITAGTVLSWSSPARRALLLMQTGQSAPLGYGELNLLDAVQGSYWLGHLLIDPQRRGCGLGRALTHLLLQRAFSHLGARRVCLVVFEENAAAVACYRAAGLHPDGHEWHYFAPYQRRARLMRMVATSPTGAPLTSPRPSGETS